MEGRVNAGRSGRRAALGPASCISLARHPARLNDMSSFATYLVGFVIVVVGLAIAAYLLNVPGMWILVGVVVLLGLGILTATSRTKPRDPPATGPTTRPPPGPTNRTY
jgi:uncharacterized membrane protein YiaA